MRLYTPLDLRNIKDTYTRSAFRRLDQWLRDLAGNLSDSQPASVQNQITIIQQQIANQETIPDYSYFDDMQRLSPGAGGALPNPAPNEINWQQFNTTGASTNIITDTTTFPQDTNPGVWKIAPGGNVGEASVLYRGTPITASQPSTCRPRGKLIAKISATITTTTQRKHLQAGFGYENLAGGAKFFGTFVGFVWWYSDLDYQTSDTYTTLTIQNDPGPGNRTNLFMVQVVDNNVAKAIVLGSATTFANALRDLRIEIEGGKVTFFDNDQQIAQMDDLALGSARGSELVAMHSFGSNNPGGDRNAFIDYFGVSEKSGL